jgi:hypothetical protein
LITSILAPWFYFRLLQKKKRFVLELFLLAAFPFVFANMVDGMDWLIFLPSFLLLLTCYVTVFAFADGIKDCYSLDEVFRTIIWLNLAQAFLGLLVRFTPGYTFMWQSINDVNEGLRLIRYRAWTYEPSYYSTLLLPLWMYAYWLVVRTRTRKAVYLLIATLIPLGMSMSFGILLVSTISIITVHMIYGRAFKTLKWVFGACVLAVVGFILLPSDNMIKVRIEHIAEGHDSSARIRTVGAFTSALTMAEARDIWFGVGAGEVKNFGFAFIDWKNGRLTSAIGDNLGEFGLVGVALRFFLEGFFFFRTRPDQDPFRLSLFISMFIFQFGGSYDGNLAEYVVWILAFSPSVGFFSTRERAAAAQVPFKAVPQFT